MERSKKRVRIGGLTERRLRYRRIARSTEIKMLKGLRAPLRHNVTRSPWILIKGVPGHPHPPFNSIVASKELPLVSCLLAGQVAGPVLSSARRPKSLRYPLQELPRGSNASEHNCPKTWTYVFFCVQWNPD